MRKFYEQLEREQIVNKFAAKGKPVPHSDEDSEHYGQEEDSAFEEH